MGIGNGLSIDWEALFSGVPEARVLEYGANRSIFWAGDPADSVFFLRKGQVKLSVTSQQGKEAIIAVLGKDEFFGEGCLAGQPLRMATATALTDCCLVRLEKSRMVTLLHDQHETRLYRLRGRGRLDGQQQPLERGSSRSEKSVEHATGARRRGYSGLGVLATRSDGNFSLHLPVVVENQNVFLADQPKFPHDVRNRLLPVTRPLERRHAAEATVEVSRRTAGARGVEAVAQRRSFQSECDGDPDCVSQSPYHIA